MIFEVRRSAVDQLTGAIPILLVSFDSSIHFSSMIKHDEIRCDEVRGLEYIIDKFAYDAYTPYSVYRAD